MPSLSVAVCHYHRYSYQNHFFASFAHLWLSLILCFVAYATLALSFFCFFSFLFKAAICFFFPLIQFLNIFVAFIIPLYLLAPGALLSNGISFISCHLIFPISFLVRVSKLKDSSTPIIINKVTCFSFVRDTV